MGIQRYVFCSIHNCEAFPSVPLMQIKACTEDFLKTSSLDYTILRLCGFHQAIIGNYAVRLPSLDLLLLLEASIKMPRAEDCLSCCSILLF